MFYKIKMANWREELLFEKGPGPFDKPLSVLKRQAQSDINKEARKKAAKKASKRSKKYRQYQYRVQDFKEKKYKNQLEQQKANQIAALEKDKERREQEQQRNIKKRE